MATSGTNAADVHKRGCEKLIKRESKVHDTQAYAFAGIVHPITGETIESYTKLSKDPATQEVRTTSFGKEIGNLEQGEKQTGTKGTNTIFFLTHKYILEIPKDRKVTYLKVVVDYQTQTADPNRVLITVRGNLIEYPGELTTRRADMIISKITWNSVLSTNGAQCMTIDITGF